MSEGKLPSQVDAIFARQLRKNRTVSECSDASNPGELPSAQERQASVLPEQARSASPLPNVPNASGGSNVLLYDKYLSKFFNPLHTTPLADPSGAGEKQRGVLYDVDGKFNYMTYNEQPRSYHPMIDIKKFTSKE